MILKNQEAPRRTTRLMRRYADALCLRGEGLDRALVRIIEEKGGTGKAARSLGVNTSTLYTWMYRLGYVLAVERRWIKRPI